MQYRKIWIAAVLAVAGSAALVTAQEAGERPQRPAGQRPATRPAPPPANLHHEMEELGRVFKALQRQVKDAGQNASSLELVQQFQQHVLASKGALPKKVTAAAGEGERKELTTNYRKMMSSLLRESLELEEQLVDGDNTKAAATLESMNEIQKQGHKEYKPQRKRN